MDKDELAEQIKRAIKSKGLKDSESVKAKEFAKAYADKMKAPKGMKVGSIADESARLGMKIPEGFRGSAIKGLSKAAKLGLRGGAGILSALDSDEMDYDKIIENPDIPQHIRNQHQQTMKDYYKKEEEDKLAEEKLKSEKQNFLEKARERRRKAVEAIKRKYANEE